MIKKGSFVADYIQPRDGRELDDEQIQPNGVDLRIGELLKTISVPVLKDDDYEHGEREFIRPIESGVYSAMGGTYSNTRNLPLERIDEGHYMYKYKDEENSEIFEMEKPFYKLLHGSYVVVYDEIIEIPEGCVGFVWPRSRFMRSNMFLTSAVWDQGYKGQGEGLLNVWRPAVVEYNMRVGQMVFVEADKAEEKYEGTHQGERLE